MKLFWKLFCSMVSITVLACAMVGFWLIDGQFRASFGQEAQSLYEENDMLRYALIREAEGQAPADREELALLAESITLTTGGRTVALRLMDGYSQPLAGSLPVGSSPLTTLLGSNQRGWRLEEEGDRRILHGASALTLLGGTVYL